VTSEVTGFTWGETPGRLENCSRKIKGTENSIAVRRCGGMGRPEKKRKTSKDSNRLKLYRLSSPPFGDGTARRRRKKEVISNQGATTGQVKPEIRGSPNPTPSRALLRGSTLVGMSKGNYRRRKKQVGDEDRTYEVVLLVVRGRCNGGGPLVRLDR